MSRRWRGRGRRGTTPRTPLSQPLSHKGRGESKLLSAAPDLLRCYPDGHRVLGGELLRGAEAPGDHVVVLLDVGWVLVGGGFLRADARLSCEHDNVASPAGAVEVEGHSGVALDVALACRVVHAVDENGVSVP